LPMDFNIVLSIITIQQTTIASLSMEIVSGETM
jgi:hypothetical protein